MIQLSENISLKPFNTFGIDVMTRYMAKISEPEDLIGIYNDRRFKDLPKYILGGGSNLLLTKNFEGIIIHNEIKGIEVINEDDNVVFIKVGSGEVWHEFVMFCIQNNYSGVENLSLIPGYVGAAPMQNIGAYGVEVKDVIETVCTIQLETLQTKEFSNVDCRFGYRESIFKQSEKNKHCITHVIFRLNKKPDFKISYGAIKDELEKFPDVPLSIRKISDAVIRIRKSKLPDPLEIGNAGSFFKNPEIPNNKVDELLKSFPKMVVYPINSETSKVAAGWLIEQAGWKGYIEKDYGVHKLQALVLVNYGNATGKNIFELSNRIIESVKEKFGISLEREVNIL